MKALRRVLSVSIVVVGICVAGPAFADTYVGQTPPTVGRVEPGAPLPAVAAKPTPTQPARLEAASVGSSTVVRLPGGLAFTGTDVVGLVLMAVMIGGSGVALVRFSRRPSSI